MESIKIHIKYKEAPLENKLTEGEIKQRKILAFRLSSYERISQLCSRKNS